MFNALKYTQDLEKAGFTRDEAEASLKVLIDVMNENFATKSDLKETELRLESAITATERRLESALSGIERRLESALSGIEHRLESSISGIKGELREMEYKLTIKLGAMMTIAVGVTATLVKLLEGLH